MSNNETKDPLKEQEKELNDSPAGVDVDEASTELQKAGWQVRVASKDGKPYMLTMDYRTDRANLHVKNGKVTNIHID